MDREATTDTNPERIEHRRGTSIGEWHYQPHIGDTTGDEIYGPDFHYPWEARSPAAYMRCASRDGNGNDFGPDTWTQTVINA